MMSSMSFLLVSRRASKRSAPRALVLATVTALLLQALVPAGFMPVSVSDGWPLALCPDRLAPNAVQALLGERGGHHHHHGMSGATASEDGQPASPKVEQCELGAAAPGAGIPAHAVIELPEFQSLSDYARSDQQPRVQRQFSSFRSRAPPTQTAA
jgi:hypothetical protein